MVSCLYLFLNKYPDVNTFFFLLDCRKDTDSVRSARPTTISTTSAQNRVATGNSNVVQMRRYVLLIQSFAQFKSAIILFES